jgi:hypothetical protein
VSTAEVYEDLDLFMVGDETDLAEPPALGDVEHVERLLRGLAWRQRKIQQARDLVEAEKQRLAEWLEEQEHRYDPSFHLQVLEGYHRARLADDPKAKTISLPSGTLTARAGQPRWEIDAEAFVPWAQTYAASLLRTKVEPAVAEIKKALQVDPDRGVAVDGTGEIVPGVHVEPAETRFTVKVGEE